MLKWQDIPILALWAGVVRYFLHFISALWIKNTYTGAYKQMGSA